MLSREMTTEVLRSFREKFSVLDYADRLRPRLGAYTPVLLVRVVAEAVILARKLGLPEPEAGTLAAMVNEFPYPEAAAEVLLGHLKRGQLFFEDHHCEVAWSFALLELERRAALSVSDPEAVISIGDGWYQRPTPEGRRQAVA